jgi:thiazolylpeptide-type bacteriocin precursor
MSAHASLVTPSSELEHLELDTFEIEELDELGINAAASPLSTLCSSTSTSSCSSSS